MTWVHYLASNELAKPEENYADLIPRALTGARRVLLFGMLVRAGATGDEVYNITQA